MLRITKVANGTTTLRVEGRLVGPWAEELEDAWCDAISRTDAARVVIDLTEVTFIDAWGRQLLARMHRAGTTLRASGCMTARVVAEITDGA